MTITDILALDMRNLVMIDGVWCIRPSALEEEHERIANKTSTLSASQRKIITTAKLYRGQQNDIR